MKKNTSRFFYVATNSLQFKWRKLYFHTISTILHSIEIGVLLTVWPKIPRESYDWISRDGLWTLEREKCIQSRLEQEYNATSRTRKKRSDISGRAMEQRRGGMYQIQLYVKDEEKNI